MTGTALRETRVYILDKKIVFGFQNRIRGLNTCIKFGRELIKEEGSVPIEDYTIHQYNMMKNKKFMKSKQYILKNKIRMRFLADIKKNTLQNIIAAGGQSQEALKNKFMNMFAPVITKEKSPGFSSVKILNESEFRNNMLSKLKIASSKEKMLRGIKK